MKIAPRRRFLSAFAAIAALPLLPARGRAADDQLRALVNKVTQGAKVSAGRAEIVTRVRLNGTQRVVALAQLSDGSYWSGSAEVEVTESACLDAT